MKIKGNESEDSFHLAGADLEQEMLHSRIIDLTQSTGQLQNRRKQSEDITK